MLWRAQDSYAVSPCGAGRHWKRHRACNPGQTRSRSAALDLAECTGYVR